MRAASPWAPIWTLDANERLPITGAQRLSFHLAYPSWLSNEPPLHFDRAHTLSSRPSLDRETYRDLHGSWG